MKEMAIQLGETSPLIVKVESLILETQTALRNKDNFISHAKRLNVKIFDPVIGFDSHFSFLAQERNFESIYLMKSETNEVHEVTEGHEEHQKQKMALIEKVKLTESEKSFILTTLKTRMELTEILKFSDLVKDYWEKLAVEMDIGDLVYSIKSSNQSNYDRSMECLNKSFQRNFSKFDREYLMKSIARADNKLLQQDDLLEIFGFGNFKNKSRNVYMYLNLIKP